VHVNITFKKYLKVLPNVTFSAESNRNLHAFVSVNTCTLIMMGVTFFLLLVILVLAVTACNLRTTADKIKPFAKRHQVMPSPEVSNKRVHVTAARRRPSNPSAPSNAGFLDVGSVQSQSPQTSPSPRNRSFYSNC